MTHSLTFERLSPGRFYAERNGIGYEITRASDWSDYVAKTVEPADGCSPEVVGAFRQLNGAKACLREIAERHRAEAAIADEEAAEERAANGQFGVVP